MPDVFEERKSKDFDDAREPRTADVWGRHNIRICPGRPSGQVRDFFDLFIWLLNYLYKVPSNS